jgi:hypothetical protein
MEVPLCLGFWGPEGVAGTDLTVRDRTEKAAPKSRLFVFCQMFCYAGWLDLFGAAQDIFSEIFG